MAEQKTTRKTTPPDAILHPVEGRVDVAEGLEEEQRDAYSARQAEKPLRKGSTRASEEAGAQASLSGVHHADLPVEGRVDVAEDVEEEQRNAYSSHRQ